MGEEQKELRREETKEAKIHMGQTSERVEKAFKGVSLFLGVLELGLACMYILFSVAWVLSGYENFLLNRKWIVLPGCFLGVTALQLLLGVTLFHGWDGWRKRFFGGAGWAVGLFLALLSEGLCFLVEDGGFLEKALTGALLFLLVYVSAYPLSLFERYGWKGALRVPFMVGWEVVLLGIEGWLFWGEENTPLTALTFLFLLLAGICAGFLRFLGKGWGKGEEPGRKKLLFARVAATALGGLLLINFFLFDTDEFFSPSLCQDEEGYFLICSREGFVWFIDRVESGYENSDARLTADIVLNDTGGWERWEEEPPENQYDCMINYSGHFDGNGYALEGYYSKKEMPVFCILEEGSSVTNLKIRKSLFQTTYEKSAYLDEDGEVMVVPASALCFADYGRIEGCEVEARVLGAWEAGGIAAVHYGEMRDCCFGGIVEGGRDYQGERGEERWARETLYVGGLCRAAQGIIENCQNEGMVSLDIISDTSYMNYASGGIVGNLYTEGKVENCINRGKVEGPQLCGGIAGASRGEIRLCANAGNVHVEQADMEYTQSLITAGICASNGGLVDSCRNTGEVTVSQRALSFYAPVYGIACNLINPQEGETGNCYYLPHRASQDYRQAGVYKLSEEEMAVVEQEMASGEDIWGEETDFPYPIQTPGSYFPPGRIMRERTRRTTFICAWGLRRIRNIPCCPETRSGTLPGNFTGTGQTIPTWSGWRNRPGLLWIAVSFTRGKRFWFPAWTIIFSMPTGRRALGGRFARRPPGRCALPGFLPPSRRTGIMEAWILPEKWVLRRSGQRTGSFGRTRRLRISGFCIT